MSQDTHEHSVVAIYPSHDGAEAAIKALQHAGLDLKHLSIVGRDFQTEEHALGFYTSGDRMRFWGGRGVVWGALWGVLLGGAFFFIPAIGPLIVMGPLVGWVVAALEGAAAGGATGVLAAALASIGIPEDAVVKYELEVKAGRFLVLAHGPAALVEQARDVLAGTGASQVQAHRREAQVTRDSVLQYLSDEEVAKVASAETAYRLAEGEQYLDLDQLEQGVRSAPPAPPPAGRLLPRASVQPQTWSRILSHLAAKNPSP